MIHFLFYFEDRPNLNYFNSISQVSLTSLFRLFRVNELLSLFFLSFNHIPHSLSGRKDRTQLLHHQAFFNLFLKKYRFYARIFNKTHRINNIEHEVFFTFFILFYQNSIFQVNLHCFCHFSPILLNNILTFPANISTLIILKLLDLLQLFLDKILRMEHNILIFNQKKQFPHYLPYKYMNFHIA